MNNMYSYAPPAQPYGYQSFAAQPQTNKIYVTSLEDAMARYASPNSTMIYVLQDESILFEIYTDMQGKKVPRVRRLAEYVAEQGNTAPAADYVKREEFDALVKKFEALVRGESV